MAASLSSRLGFALCLLLLVALAAAEPEAAEGQACVQGGEEDTDAVCALQHVSLKPEARELKKSKEAKEPEESKGSEEAALSQNSESEEPKPSKKVSAITKLASRTTSQVKGKARGELHSKFHGRKAHKRPLSALQAKKRQEAAGADKNKWYDDQPDDDEWDTDRFQDDDFQGGDDEDEQNHGFGILDWAELEWAEAALDDLDNEEFDSEVGMTGLPLTIGFVNDLRSRVYWDSSTMDDGHYWMRPDTHDSARPGEIMWLQAYAHSDGLAGKVRLKDEYNNYLSIAFSSYRMGNYFTGCDKLKVRAMWTSEWAEPAGAMCTTEEAGIYRRNDYEVLVSMARAE